TIMGRAAPQAATMPAAQAEAELESALDEGEEETNFTLLGRISTALRGATNPVRRLWLPAAEKDKVRGPRTFEVMIGAINIMQDRITRSRLAGEPPDVLLAP